MIDLELYRKRYTSVEENRNTYIGGSDMGTILGINPFKSAYTLYLEKTGQIVPEDISDQEAVWWGTEMEDLVAKRFEKKAKDAGYDLGVHRTSFEFRSKKYPFLVAHIDREVFDRRDGEVLRVGLECKTTSSWNKTDYEGGDIPPAHYAQVQFYMAMTNAPHWFYAVKRDSEFHWCVVERDDGYIEAMLNAAEAFWKHVEAKDEEIHADGSKSSTESLNQRYKADPDEMIDVTAFENQINAIVEVNKSIKALEDVKAQAQNALREHMGTASIGLIEGYSVSWKEQTSDRFDSTRFKADHPDLYKEYAKASTSRVLRINRKKVKK